MLWCFFGESRSGQHEVAHHSETMSYIRLRRLLNEDEPRIDGYARPSLLVDYGRAGRSMHPRPFRAVRESSAELLDRINESDWEHHGVHSESSDYSVQKWLVIYAAHAFDHADQIRRARSSAAN
jgi:hypothetical protein